jgi:hypothetical protein
MALDNLISVTFTPEELSSIDASMNTIEAILAGKAVNLTPKQRNQYGRVAYEKEKWVDRVFGYMQQYPGSVPPYINMDEHVRDMEAHRALNPRIDRMTGILQQMADTNLLLGYDIDYNSRTYYRAQGEAAKANDPGATTRYQDLKQEFVKGHQGRKKPEAS